MHIPHLQNGGGLYKAFTSGNGNLGTISKFCLSLDTLTNVAPSVKLIFSKQLVGSDHFKTNFKFLGVRLND